MSSQGLGESIERIGQAVVPCQGPGHPDPVPLIGNRSLDGVARAERLIALRANEAGILVEVRRDLSDNRP
jgi:hypothetical protein